MRNSDRINVRCSYSIIKHMDCVEMCYFSFYLYFVRISLCAVISIVVEDLLTLVVLFRSERVNCKSDDTNDHDNEDDKNII